MAATRKNFANRVEFTGTGAQNGWARTIYKETPARVLETLPSGLAVLTWVQTVAVTLACVMAQYLVQSETAQLVEFNGNGPLAGFRRRIYKDASGLRVEDTTPGLAWDWYDAVTRVEQGL